jgi:hypothetical protein
LLSIVGRKRSFGVPQDDERMTRGGARCAFEENEDQWIHVYGSYGVFENDA